MTAAALKTARIVVTGSRRWVDRQTGSDALSAALAILGSVGAGSTLLHGGAEGADQLLADEAQKLRMSAEFHPAQWNSGAELALAFPTHGYALATGENPARTSRGTWTCAEAIKKTGVPTLVVWGKELYPFGDAAREQLRQHMQLRQKCLGPQGQAAILDVWLPF